MTGGIVTLLALLGFLAVVIYVFVIKRKEDFDEQARQPLKDRNDDPENRRNDHQAHRNSGNSEDGEKQS